MRCQPRYYWAKKRREIREKGKKCKKSAREREREREAKRDPSKRSWFSLERSIVFFLVSVMVSFSSSAKGRLSSGAVSRKPNACCLQGSLQNTRSLTSASLVVGKGKRRENSSSFAVLRRSEGDVERYERSRRRLVATRVSFSSDEEVAKEEEEEERGQQIASLSSLPFKSVISVDGEVHPEQEEREGVESSVFAVFDQARQLQFVGFSKHLKNSLRTMLGRQSDFCYFYKHVDFPHINQEEMLGVRNAWFEENHGAPPGNTPQKIKLWQQPLFAGGVSEKGKQVAAKQLLETILKRLDQRGLREEFVPNEDMLLEGKVEFLPARELTEEEKQKKKELRMKVLEATRTCSVVVDGKEQTFLLFFENIFEANGGAMVDFTVTKDDNATSHRVIIGEDYLKALEMPIQNIVERTVAFLLEKKVDRKTEGMLMSNQFPINYFALSTVDQWFGDFALAFETKAGEEAKLPGEDKFWRFNRIHDYGWSADDRYKG